MIDRPRIRQLGLGELLDESFRLYRNNFVTFVAIAALVLVPYSMFNFLAQLPYQAQLERLQQQTTIGAAPIGQNPFDLFSGLLFGLLSVIGVSMIYTIVFQPLLEGALARAIAQRYLGQPISLGDSFGVALRRILALVGARLIPSVLGFVFGGLVFALIVGLFAVVLGIGLSADGLDQIDAGGAIALVFCLFGLGAIFFVLALLLVVRILFTSQAVVVEDRGPWAALVRSWNLTAGYFWRTLGYVLVIWLIVMFVSLIPSLLFSVPAQILLANQPRLMLLINTIVTAIMSVLVTPLGLIAYTLMYFDLRIRKEAFDLEQQTSALLAAGVTPLEAR